jgi:hypothetical protein
MFSGTERYPIKSANKSSYSPTITIPIDIAAYKIAYKIAAYKIADATTDAPPLQQPFHASFFKSNQGDLLADSPRTNSSPNTNLC